VRSKPVPPMFPPLLRNLIFTNRKRSLGLCLCYAVYAELRVMASVRRLQLTRLTKWSDGGNIRVSRRPLEGFVAAGLHWEAQSWQE